MPYYGYMSEEHQHPEPGEDLVLSVEIKSLREHLTRINSLRYRLLLGIVGGVGTAIGATVIAAILFVIISRLVMALGFGDAAITEQIQEALSQ